MTAGMQSILWRRCDRPGLEAARLEQFGPAGSGWRLTGNLVVEDHGRGCALEYRVTCDRLWCTRRALVRGWIGTDIVDVELEVDDAGQWTVNDIPQPSVRGCVDVDFGFTPATNLLPIRRLALAVGEEARVRAAWLRFPSLTVEPLEQRYRREDERRYLYDSAFGRFTATLDVNEHGLVTQYGDVWVAVAPELAGI